MNFNLRPIGARKPCQPKRCWPAAGLRNGLTAACASSATWDASLSRPLWMLFLPRMPRASSHPAVRARATFWESLPAKVSANESDLSMSEAIPKSIDHGALKRTEALPRLPHGVCDSRREKDPGRAVGFRDSKPAGEIVGTITVAHDLTKIRRLEDELAKKNRFMANILRDSADAIMTMDPNDIVTSWNKGAERIFGYLANEMVGKPVQILVPPELREARELESISRRFRAQGAVRSHQTERITKDGRRIQVIFTRTAIRDDSGQIIGSSSVVKDVTSVREPRKTACRCGTPGDARRVIGGTCPRNQESAGRHQGRDRCDPGFAASVR